MTGDDRIPMPPSPFSRRRASGRALGLLGALLLVLVGLAAPVRPASAATAGSAFLPIDATRVYSSGPLSPAAIQTFALTPPTGATTVVLQVTGRPPAGGGEVRFCGGVSRCAAPGRFLMAAGHRSAGIVRVPLNGPLIGVSTTAGGQVWADVIGYDVPAGTAGAGTFVPAGESSTSRRVSIRSNAFSALALPGAPRNAVGAAVSVTVDAPSAAGYVSVCPSTQADGSCRRASAVNTEPGERRTVAVLSKVGPDGALKLYSNAVASSATVDVLGWFVAGSQGAGLVPVSETARQTITAGTSGYLAASLPRGTVAVSARVTLSGAWRAADVLSCASATADCRRQVASTFAAAGAGRSTDTVLPVDAQGRVRLLARDASVRVKLEITGALVPAGTPAGPQPSAAPTPAPAPATAPTAGATPTPALTSPSTPAHTAPAPSETPDSSLTPTPAGSAAASIPGAEAGVPSGAALTKVTGDMTITEAGTVVDGIDLSGRISVLAPDVTIKNSIIRGNGPVTSGLPLVLSQSTNLLIQDSEIAADVATPDVNGVMGSNFTLERVNIHDVVDQVHIYGDGNVTIRDSWLHDNLHYDNDPNWGGAPSHDDNVQIQNGSGITIANSRLEGGFNAAVQVTQDRGPVSDLTIEGNLIGGGGCSVNIAEKGRGPVQSTSVTGNQFLHNQRIDGCAIIRPLTSPIAIDANTWTDGSDVVARRG